MLDISIKKPEWHEAAAQRNGQLFHARVFMDESIASNFSNTIDDDDNDDDARKIWITARRNPNERVKKLVLSFVFLLVVIT